jgi:hypothetical protein
VDDELGLVGSELRDDSLSATKERRLGADSGTFRHLSDEEDGVFQLNGSRVKSVWSDVQAKPDPMDGRFAGAAAGARLE